MFLGVYMLPLSGDSIYGQSTAHLLGCLDLPQIYFGATLVTFAPPELDMSNYLLIYWYSVQPIHTQIFNKNPRLILSHIDDEFESESTCGQLAHIQIFNKNPRWILSLIDLQFESAVNLWLTCSYTDSHQKSAIDLVTHRSSI